MSDKKRYNFKKVLVIAVWIIVGLGTGAVLIAAMNKKNSERCKAVDIKIIGVKNNLFIDSTDVIRMLEKMNLGKLKGRSINSFDLVEMEAILKRNEWIKNAELFFDNNDVLRINIMEREPIARIFNTAGSSFYIDSSLTRLQLSDKFSARLSAFTNFSSGADTFSKDDRNLLTGIKDIATFIMNDPFWMAQIDQVDITPEGTFEMIPKIGNQVIVFGSSENFSDKFNNLLIFYKSVQSKVGWNKYSKINVSYRGQVIGVKRGTQDIKMDALKTIQLMKQLVANSQKQANDSSKNIQLVQPKEENIIPVSQPQENKFFGTETDFGRAQKNSINVLPTLPVPVMPHPASQAATGSKNINDHSGRNETKNTSNTVEKPKPVLMKKTMAKPVFEKPKPVLGREPKTVMPPKNDY